MAKYRKTKRNNKTLQIRTVLETGPIVELMSFLDFALTSLAMSASVRLKKAIRHFKVAVTIALLPARPT